MLRRLMTPDNVSMGFHTIVLLYYLCAPFSIIQGDEASEPPIWVDEALTPSTIEECVVRLAAVQENPAILTAPRHLLTTEYRKSFHGLLLARAGTLFRPAIERLGPLAILPDERFKLHVKSDDPCTLQIVWGRRSGRDWHMVSCEEIDLHGTNLLRLIPKEDATDLVLRFIGSAKPCVELSERDFGSIELSRLSMDHWRIIEQAPALQYDPQNPDLEIICYCDPADRTVIAVTRSDPTSRAKMGLSE